MLTKIANLNDGLYRTSFLEHTLNSFTTYESSTPHSVICCGTGAADLSKVGLLVQEVPAHAKQRRHQDNHSKNGK